MASWEEVTCHDNQNWWWDILPIGLVVTSGESSGSTSGSDDESSCESDVTSESDHCCCAKVDFSDSEGDSSDTTTSGRENFVKMFFFEI